MGAPRGRLRSLPAAHGLIAMPSVVFSMGVSLDGYIAGRRGEIDWSAPDEELHRFHNQQTRELGAHFCGRRLYEEMRYWDTPEASAGDEAEREFAEVWQALPKVVFSSTLRSVEGNARLATGGIEAEGGRLREEAGGDLAVGGGGLAGGFAGAGLIDDSRLFVSPVVLGGGTPFFPPLEQRVELELVETRTFGSRIVYLRYAVPRP